MKGTYILMMNLEKDCTLPIGKRGPIDFKNGWYCYVGSGLNGLESRIRRHLRSDKKFHWHIDYFLKDAEIKDIFIKQAEQKEECSVATSFSHHFFEIPFFGCSDCHCTSHLFHGKKERFLDHIMNLGFKTYRI